MLNKHRKEQNFSTSIHIARYFNYSLIRNFPLAVIKIFNKETSNTNVHQFDMIRYNQTDF